MFPVTAHESLRRRSSFRQGKRRYPCNGADRPQPLERAYNPLYCYHGGVNGGLPISATRALATVFLDRDGVINEKMAEGRYVTSWSEFKVLPGVPQAIARLNRAGLRVAVVTNQRCVALGLCTAGDVRELHSAFQRLLNRYGAHVDGFYFCPHDKSECNCRKPLAGLFEQAAAQFPEISAGSSAMIGDSLSDIEFGRRLGMLTVLIDGDPERRKPGWQAAAALAELRFASLAEAIDGLL